MDELGKFMMSLPFLFTLVYLGLDMHVLNSCEKRLEASSKKINAPKMPHIVIGWSGIGI